MTRASGPGLGIDTWSARCNGGRWRVVDRNGCEVADCGNRKEDADLIVHYSHTHEQLLRALRAALPYLESTYENLQSFGMDFEDARLTLQRAAAALDSVASPPAVDTGTDADTGAELGDDLTAGPHRTPCAHRPRD